MGARSARVPGSWIAAAVAVLVITLVVLTQTRPEPSLAGSASNVGPVLFAVPPTSIASGSGTGQPHPGAASRTDVTVPMLQIIDWHGRPVDVLLTWLSAEGPHSETAAAATVQMPATWSHVLVQQPNWLPLCVGADEVERPARGPWLLRLPVPSLIARVAAPADGPTPKLFADVRPPATCASWPAPLRARGLSEGSADRSIPLALMPDQGLLVAGGLSGGDLVLQERGEYLFRDSNGSVNDHWHTAIPSHAGVIELVRRPLLRVTPRLASATQLDTPLSLYAELTDKSGAKLGTADRPVLMDQSIAFALPEAVSYAKLQLFAGKDKILVAATTLQVAPHDQEETLWIGADSFMVVVVDQAGARVPEACILEEAELLAISNERGEACIAGALRGPIDAIARDFDCAEATLDEVRATRRIVLPSPTGLAIDARAAMRVLGHGSVTISGSFAAPCSSRASDRLLRQWNERAPSGSMGHGMMGGRMMLSQLTYKLEPDEVLTLRGLFRPGETVHIQVCDRVGTPTEIGVDAKLLRGQMTRIELPIPATRHFLGSVVSAVNGRPVSGARIHLGGSGFLFRHHEEEVVGSRIDVCLAAGSTLELRAPGHLPRTFSQPEPSGVYRLLPGRSLRVHVVDQDGAPVGCHGVLRDGDGREYPGTDVETGDLQFDEVPAVALSVRLSRGDEAREFAVPSQVTTWTAEWQ